MNSIYTSNIANSTIFKKPSYKEKYSFEKRLNEATRIINKYPNRIPVIVERDNNEKEIQLINKNKYLVPISLTVGQFVYVIRKRLILPPEKAILLFINNVLPPTASLLGTIYDEYKDKDHFLYIKYSGENTFG